MGIEIPPINKDSTGKNNNSTKGGLAKIAGLVGFTALSLMPKETANTTHENENINSLKEKHKIEWTRDEIKGGKLPDVIAKYMKKVIEDDKERRQMMISEISEDIEQYSKEYEHRIKTGEITAIPFWSTEELPREIERLRELLKHNKEWLSDDNLYPTHSNEFLEGEAKEIERDIISTINCYEKGIEWLLQNIKSEDYKKRLEKELGYEEASEESLKESFYPELLEYLTEFYQADRVKEAEDKNYILTEDMSRSSGSLSLSGTAGDAFYTTKNNKVYFPLRNKASQEDSLGVIATAIHEYAHKVVGGNKNITSSTWQLFYESFDSLSAVNFFIKELSVQDTVFVLSYFSKPAEMYARKKVFDYDLERLGIKKYGEEFTYDHYLKVLKAQDQLSLDGLEFLKIIKPEKIVKIMNEIAFNDPPESTNSSEDNLIG